MTAASELAWRTPEELITEGFARSQVVLMNEAHSGLKRCVRTREVGWRILPAAHAGGARHLALEALRPDLAAAANETRRAPDESRGYLAQPDMQALIQAALDLGWTLWAYEADSSAWLAERGGQPAPHDEAGWQRLKAELRTQAFTNWREAEQANKLVSIFEALPEDDGLLVWCGNGHLCKRALPDWTPMGYHLSQRLEPAPYALDQSISVNFPRGPNAVEYRLGERYGVELAARGGTAGWLRADAPPDLPDFGADAYLIALDNELD